MSYVPKWEPIILAVRRLISIGISEEHAKIDLCHAISDRRLALRALVGGDGVYFEGVTFHDGEIHPPLRLQPSHIDWENSRPIAPWTCFDGGLRALSIDLLEVSTGDMEAVFPQSTSVRLKKDTGRPRRIAESAIEPAFKEWRESRPESIPTETEDCVAMKIYGVNREKVRDLRKGYPRLPPGRPKIRPI